MEEPTEYCMCDIPAWGDALAIAQGRAALTGLKHDVWRGEHTGSWHVTRTRESVKSLAGEPCS